MGKIESINITLSGNLIFILLGSLLLILYTLYIYKYTTPVIPSQLRYLLIIIRMLVIIFILLIIFEPQLSVKHSILIEKTNYLFIDNSSSLSVKDSSTRLEKISAFRNDFNELNKARKKEYLFGIEPVEFSDTGKLQINFSEPLTNFAKIFDLLKSADDINTITIVSDGIITDGHEPIYETEKIGAPVFTIGIGDSSYQKDIYIKDVIFNQNIYAEKPTEIEVSLIQTGYDNQLTRVSLFEEDKLVQTKDVQLSSTGISKIKFDFTPRSSGEKRMRITTSALPSEFNSINNSKVFYLNVIKSKVKVTVVSGSPSPDLSSILNSLSADKNIDVRKIVQIGPNKFIDELNLALIDSADILFVIDFPRQNSSEELINKVFRNIQNNKPFFLQITPNTDLNKLKRLETYLPVSISSINDENILIQPDIVTGNFNSIFSSMSAQQNIWLSLPPINRNNSELIPKAESSILIRSIAKNIPLNTPLLVSRSLGRQRSISLIAGDIWRWQLSVADRNPFFFSNFINDIVKWLNLADSKKQFTIRPGKKIYDVGEKLEFTAELYDQTFTPISSAEVTLDIRRGPTNYNLKLDKLKDGIFVGDFESMVTGDYSFEATAKFDGVELKSDAGRFSIVPGSIEKLDTRMNINFLKQLAHISGGRYYSIDDYKKLIGEIKKINQNMDSSRIIFDEIQLWSNMWTIVLIISLFTIEWFIRKRIGML